VLLAKCTIWKSLASRGETSSDLRGTMKSLPDV
jgi:hypothetical protein